LWKRFTIARFLKKTICFLSFFLFFQFFAGQGVGIGKKRHAPEFSAAGACRDRCEGFSGHRSRNQNLMIPNPL
jgi:hypothetical protein